MTAREVLRHIIERDNRSYTELGKKLGLTRQTVWDNINSKKNKEIGSDRFVTVANLLGYKVMLVPEDVKNPTGSIEIRGNKGGDTDDRANICKGNEG